MDNMAAAETAWPAPVILGQMFLAQPYETVSGAAARRHRLEIRRLKTSKPASVIKRQKHLLSQIGQHMEELSGVSAGPVEVGGRAACVDAFSPTNSQLVKSCVANNFVSVAERTAEDTGLRQCEETPHVDSGKGLIVEVKLQSSFTEQGNTVGLPQGDGDGDEGSPTSTSTGTVADSGKGFDPNTGLTRAKGNRGNEDRSLEEATRSNTCDTGKDAMPRAESAAVGGVCSMESTICATQASGQQDSLIKAAKELIDGGGTASVETGLAIGQLEQCMLSDSARPEADSKVEGGKEVTARAAPSTSTNEWPYPGLKTIEAKNECPPHGCLAICGRRRDMEDAIAAIPVFATVACGDVGGCKSLGLSCGTKDEKCHLHFFGVFDGHGGSQASKYCADRLHQALAAEMRNGLGGMKGGSLPCESLVSPEGVESVSQEWWRRALSNSFMLLDYHVTGQCNGGPCCKQPGSNCSPPGIGEGGMNTSPCLVETIAPESTGSTAVVAVVGKTNLVVANVGDSRAVLARGGQTIALSKDHKPEREDELARVEEAGGRVIFWNGWRVLGVLAMSRAIGDRYLKPYVIAEPEVTFTLRSDDDEFLILASDGLWDVMENERACDVVRRCLKAQRRKNKAGGYVLVEDPVKYAASTLIKMAYKKGSQDNISVVVIDLKKR